MTEAHASTDDKSAANDHFRDSLGTADQQGRRLWVFPKKPSGPLYRWRSIVSIFQLAFLLGAPFVKIGGQPLLMFNIIERKFVIFGKVFWPQDLFLFALGMLCFFVFIILFTAVYGRLFCGWLCPQTVFLEMLFRKVEYWIDGDGPQQRVMAQAPWSVRKLVKRLLKHGIFFGLAFVIGNVLLAYIIGSEALFEIITDDPREHLGGLAVMIIFSGIFYWIYAFFREQVCCFICPYGRLQSVMLDENSLVVSYDYKRGESRGRFQRGDTREIRSERGTGDCINCGMCHRVCPTGIDIRNGTQMECVNCTACIDACNFMMEKVGLPKGLIRYASQSGIDEGRSFQITPRVIIYSVVLIALSTVMLILLATRQGLDVQLLHAHGQTYSEVADQAIQNMYTAKATNKTTEAQSLTFTLDSHPQGSIMIVGGDFIARPERASTSTLLITIPKDSLRPFSNTIRIGVYQGDQRLKTVETIFQAP